MAKISELIHHIETFAPLYLQEDFDNSGLQVGDPGQEFTSALLCVDVTEAVVAEAVLRNANLIISHHPLIFRGIKQISGRNYIERVILQAIRNNIVIYSAHTNIDKCVGGVSFRMAKKIGLQNVSVLHPDGVDGKTGLGCIGILPSPLSETAVLTKLKQEFGLYVVRHSALLGRKVSSIALCGGSGAEFIKDSMRCGADMYVTADIKYHDFFLAEDRIVIADIGHYESEQFTKEIFYEQLIEFFPNFAILMAESDKNPVRYS